MNTAKDKTADAVLRILGHVDPPEDLYSVLGSDSTTLSLPTT
ncbi:hypothetical protein J2Y66_004136 [Paenarthrobacter nitroguajacolicus]|nr:hypothetical protein [Paenarthrobacter nitroguajacolicus]MDR6989619.1 hypothetical protein [Paenarthrobacter nitroguajacolicus]